MSTTETLPQYGTEENPIVIIACGAEKLDHAAPAHEMYLGGMFRMNLAAAVAVAGTLARVMILSAKYGLIPATQMIDPYDVKMGDAGCVEAADLIPALLPVTNPDRCSQEIYAMVPKAYWERLQNAAWAMDIAMTWVNEGDAGIGYQRGTAGCVARTYADNVAA